MQILSCGVPAIRETAGPPTRRRFDPQTLVVRNAAFQLKTPGRGADGLGVLAFLREGQDRSSPVTTTGRVSCGPVTLANSGRASRTSRGRLDARLEVATHPPRCGRSARRGRRGGGRRGRARRPPVQLVGELRSVGSVRGDDDFGHYDHRRGAEDALDRRARDADLPGRSRRSRAGCIATRRAHRRLPRTRAACGRSTSSTGRRARSPAARSTTWPGTSPRRSPGRRSRGGWHAAATGSAARRSTSGRPGSSSAWRSCSGSSTGAGRSRSEPSTCWRSSRSRLRSGSSTTAGSSRRSRWCIPASPG